jgi:ribonuclease HI
MPMRKLDCYTDGSCPVNPGPGGWAYVIAFDEPIEQSGYVGKATNNTMEVMAAIKCLERLIAEGTHNLFQISVWSDSRYVVNGFQTWRHQWATFDFETCYKNRELWKQAHDLAEQFPRLRFKWLKGHSGHYHNTRCDHMAGAAVKIGNRRQYAGKTPHTVIIDELSGTLKGKTK